MTLNSKVRSGQLRRGTARRIPARRRELKQLLLSSPSARPGPTSYGLKGRNLASGRQSTDEARSLPLRPVLSQIVVDDYTRTLGAMGRGEKAPRKTLSELGRGYGVKLGEGTRFEVGEFTDCSRTASSVSR